jgi:hypothetical protein
MGLFSRFLVADPAVGAAPLPGLRAASLDLSATAAFAAAKIPFGNRVLTMISVWLEGVKTRG